MEEDVKHVLEMILNERMKTKAALEEFRMLEEAKIGRSYQNQINHCLDRLKELDDLYKKIKNK
jgi:hypothetical protein